MDKATESFARFAADRLKNSHRDESLQKARERIIEAFSGIEWFFNSQNIKKSYFSTDVSDDSYTFNLLDDSFEFEFNRKDISVTYSSNSLVTMTDTIVYRDNYLISKEFGLYFSDNLIQKYLEFLRPTLDDFAAEDHSA